MLGSGLLVEIACVCSGRRPERVNAAAPENAHKHNTKPCVFDVGLKGNVATYVGIPTDAFTFQSKFVCEVMFLRPPILL